MRRLFAPVLPVLLAVAALGASVGPVRAATDSGARRCNGMVELCDRSLGDVAFATTHNSMASSDDGFIGPNQARPISWQLDHDIRGFQIDSFEGVDRGNAVSTELTGAFGGRITDLPAPLVATAERIHTQIGAPPPGTPTEVFLCHSFCELGAVSFDSVAADFRTFLDDHPNDVLAIVIEDYVVPERMREVLAAHGLDREMVATQPGQPLPTLGEMIDAGTRLFVSLENGDGGPTMPNAFTGLVDETPFNFLHPGQLRGGASCVANRGLDGSPVFQFNHWVTPPVRQTARLVNGRLLRDRVARCTRDRGRSPSLIAVDFAETGDVVGVTKRINREG